MDNSTSKFLDQIHDGFARRSKDLHAECKELVEQRSSIFRLAVAAAVCAAGLILSGIGYAVFDPASGTGSLTALCAVVPVCLSGGFGWTAKRIRMRLNDLEYQIAWEAEQNYLTMRTLLIEDQTLRDKTTANIIAMAASQLFESANRNQKRGRRHFR